MQEILKRAEQIRLVIFDVDGVLTDGGMFFGENGQEYKVFNSRDGHGMTMLQQTGVKLAVISGRSSGAVRIRMHSLGVEHIYLGHEDKIPAYGELKRATALADHQIAYVGDDVLDLPVMCRVGLAVAVADAHPLVRQHAHWATPSPGGRGAGRDVCELIMEAQGNLERMLGRYL